MAQQTEKHSGKSTSADRSDQQRPGQPTKPDQTVQSMAQETLEAARSWGEELREELRSVAQDGLEEGKAQIGAQASKARDKAVSETKETGAALREAADRFDQDDYRRSAAMHIADTLDGVADSLRQRDLGDWRADIESFARRNPLLFYAGAALTGFALSRAFRATARGGDDPAQEPPMSGGGYPAPAIATGGAGTGEEARP